MASFQAKISWERLRKREKKSFQRVPTRPVIENFKKIVKKFKNLENAVMASFQAKICWGRLRNRKNKKKIVPMITYQTCNTKFQKNSKKIQQIRKHYYGFFSSQNMLGKAEKEKN